MSRIRKLLDAAMDGGRAGAEAIVELRGLGRADDVTDQMMSAAEPRAMWDLTPLPMDQASRYERARQMGFDIETPLFHGTRADIGVFEPSQSGKIGPGVYLTPNERMANVFAGYNYGPNARLERMMNEDLADGAQVYPLFATNRPADEETRAIARQARSAYDDTLDAYHDTIGAMGFDGVSVEDQRTILDPSNIRSVFARFDPAFRHLGYTSAAGAGALIAPWETDDE